MSDLFQWAETARDLALDKVAFNNAEWFDKVLMLIPSHSLGEFTGEELRQRITPLMGHPSHHNAWGSVIRTAIKRGLIEGTGQYKKMTTVKSHARATAVYRRKQ